MSEILLFIGMGILFVVLNYFIVVRPVQKLQQTVSELRVFTETTRGLLQQSQSETANLSRALHSTTGQGNWGELQLRRVVELAGMIEYCDFETQVTLWGSNGQQQRPDLLVRIHNERIIIIDAKAPVATYTDAQSEIDEKQRINKLKQYAKNVRTHVQNLANKAYWQQVQPAPSLVILFIPNEAMFRAALEYDKSLLDDSIQKNVLLASPITLVALLKAIAYGWSQENRTKNVQQMLDQSQQMQKDLVELIDKWNELGTYLNKTVSTFNQLAYLYTGKLLPRVEQLRILDTTSTSTNFEVKTIPNMSIHIDQLDEETP